MNQKNIFKKSPEILAFNCEYKISDALIFNWSLDGEETPVEVLRHSIRGTQKEKNIPTIQTIEVAKLQCETKIMTVRFSLAFSPRNDRLNQHADKNSCQAFSGERNFESVTDIAQRYARNIANGSWLLRNKDLASHINIIVLVSKGANSNHRLFAYFDALTIDINNNIDEPGAAEIKLAREIANQIEGDSNASLIIEAMLTLHVTGSEIFPSQCYDTSRVTELFKPLYSVNYSEEINSHGVRAIGQAALHHRDIFKAICGINTVY